MNAQPIVSRIMGSVYRPSHEKYWNLLWSGSTVVLAVDTIVAAIKFREIDTFFYFLIHLLIAIFFLTRYQPKSFSDQPMAYIVAVLSIHYFFLYDSDPILKTEFGVSGLVVTVVGSLLCLLSIFSIGKCFGVLPIYRGLQIEKMYRFVRHPIYASYVVMDIGLLLSYFSVWNVFVFSTVVFLFLVRINFEEQLMSQTEAYRNYQLATPFKLIPGIL